MNQGSRILDIAKLRFRLVIVSTQFFRKTFDINIFNLRFNPTTIILQLQEVYTTYCAAVTCILPLF